MTKSLRVFVTSSLIIVVGVFALATTSTPVTRTFASGKNTVSPMIDLNGS